MSKEDFYGALYKEASLVRDVYIVPKNQVDILLAIHRLSLEDIKDVYIQSTDNNTYFDESLKQYKPIDYDQLLLDTKKEVFKNIPTFLQIIVDDIPLYNGIANFDCEYDFDRNKIVFDSSYTKGRVASELTHKLGKTYWEAFCSLLELEEAGLANDVGDIASGDLKVPDMEPSHKRYLFKQLEENAKQNKFNVMVKTTDINDVAGIAILMKFLFSMENNCKK